MKKINLFTLCLCLSALAIVFSGCKDDDDEPQVEISMENLKGDWDIVRCYGWEYANGDHTEKDYWDEEITDESVIFDEYGNGTYSTGIYHQYNFTYSLNGNQFIHSEEWLFDKEATITKLTKDELNIQAIDEYSEENYVLRRRI